MSAARRKTEKGEVAILIPAYNEASVIGPVIRNLARHFDRIICVDDGSNDSTAAEVQKTSAQLVQHPVNLGQGAALQTAIEFALRDPNTVCFVTFDADGQHSVEDALKLVKYIQTHPADIVLGSRFLGDMANVGALKRRVLKLAVAFSNLTSGVHLTDTHNGLRAFNRRVAERLDLQLLDMAHASEIIHRIAENNFAYAEVPVTILYSDYSKAKGQSLVNAINISFDVLAHKVHRK